MPRCNAPPIPAQHAPWCISLVHRARGVGQAGFAPVALILCFPELMGGWQTGDVFSTRASGNCVRFSYIYRKFE